MTLTAKAQVIERDFQLARGRANYATFPEFARRYVKHNKDGVGKEFDRFGGRRRGQGRRKKREEPWTTPPTFPWAQGNTQVKSTWKLERKTKRELVVRFRQDGTQGHGRYRCNRMHQADGRFNSSN